jgi:hypothetical protein
MDAAERLRAFIEADPELVWLRDKWESDCARPDVCRLDVSVAVVPPRKLTAIERLKEAIDADE